MKKVCFVLPLLLAVALSCGASSKNLYSLSVKDKTKTTKTMIKLSGSAKSLFLAKVNNIELEDIDNSFGCGLILTPGKNLAKAEVWDKDENYESRELRILRLVTFPDLELLYNGRPHWAQYLIATLATLGITEGYPDNNFYMNKSLTRGEIATWIAKAQGLKTTVPTQDVFRDVPKEHWRAPYIKAIVDKGYMRGDDQGNFGIDIPISRGEAAFTALKAEGASFEKEIVAVFFYDVPKDNPFFEQIKLAKDQGLVKGMSWKTAIFEPERDITRAEATVLISRFERIKTLSKWLYDFNQGFKEYCKINTAPKVKEIEVIPQQFNLRDTPAMAIKANIEDREGIEDILYVKADISSFGGPPDAEMRDDGKFGDKVKGDAEYTLQILASAESFGEKIITVTATDKYGTQGKGSTKVLVVK